MSKENGSKTLPAFIAWHVPEREGAPWARIGAAWPHRDGKGFDVVLDLIPVSSGRITLRAHEPKQDEAET